jgi:hypothetical protein
MIGEDVEQPRGRMSAGVGVFEETDVPRAGPAPRSGPMHSSVPTPRQLEVDPWNGRDAPASRWGGTRAEEGGALQALSNVRPTDASIRIDPLRPDRSNDSVSAPPCGSSSPGVGCRSSALPLRRFSPL